MRNICLLFLALAGNLTGERMWLFDFARDVDRVVMEAAGGRVDPVEIYSVNHYSVKDAVVKLSDGSTGAVISDDGLVVSTSESLSLAGVSAADDDREMPVPGLTVTFLVEIEDVSRIIKRAEARGADCVQRAFDDLKKDAETRQWQSKAVIQDFGDGIFYLISYRTYRDVRRVIPASSEGMPCSLFRVYADKNNAPADFNESNIPYRPGKKIETSMEDIPDGAFRIQIGYPMTHLMPVITIGSSMDAQGVIVLDADGKLTGNAVNYLKQTGVLK